jgi:hypothetical protein
MAGEKVATHLFVAEVDGRTVVVIPGARFPNSAPVVKAHASQFEAPKRRGRHAGR